MYTPSKPLPVARLGLMFMLALTSPQVFAYIGPGAGLTAIGSFIALVVAVVVAFIGFLWFPVKRMLKKHKNGEKPDTNKQ